MLGWKPKTRDMKIWIAEFEVGGKGCDAGTETAPGRWTEWGNKYSPRASRRKQVIVLT